MRYLGGLNESIRNVVKLQTYSALDEVSILAHKVELQRRAKIKQEAPKPPQRAYPFSKEGQSVPSKPLNTPTSPSTPKPLFPNPHLTYMRRADAINVKVFTT